VSQFGWVDSPRDVEAFLSTLSEPMFARAAAPIADSGKGKAVLLHKNLEKVLGKFPIHNQTIGDCVSHGWSLCIDVLKATEIVAGEAESFNAETATEAIYALSRVEIGGGRLGNEDGSLGAWAADAVKKYGTLARIKYGNYDLTTYDGQRAKAWGGARKGLPDELEPIAKEHPVTTVSLVTTYEQARDAIANGYPVPVCSMQGFAETRDADGFAAPKGTWPHCMAFIAVDDAYKRPGLLCMNSWGPDWIRGPKRNDQPDGSFWVDADVVNRMLAQRDSFAISGFQGYPARKLPETWLS